MDTKRIAEIGRELTDNYDGELIAHDLGNELKGIAEQVTEFEFTGILPDKRIRYSVNHEIFNVIEVIFPEGYFLRETPPSRVEVLLGIPQQQEDISERLARHGFKCEWTGGNCSAYIRYDGDISEWITVYDSPEIPRSLADRVTVGTYEGKEQSDGDIVNGYTLAEIIAALDNPSDEYALLSLRLHNGFHNA